VAGAAWSAHQGDYPAALLSLGAGLLSLQGMPDTSSAYFYLFTAQRRLGR
jgi:hypothetical protein